MKEIQDDDPEVKRDMKVHTISIKEGILETLESLIFDWMRMKRVVAWIFKILSSRVRQNSVQILPKIGLDVSLLEEAQQEVIRLHQRQAFKEEVETLMHGCNDNRKTIMKRSKVYKVDPFIDERGLLRVGGSLKKSNLYFTDVHPILLSRDNYITRSMCHQKAAHCGRGLTINDIRSNEFRSFNATQLLGAW